MNFAEREDRIGNALPSWPEAITSVYTTHRTRWHCDSKPGAVYLEGASALAT
jgi:hypothetical protein